MLGKIDLSKFEKKRKEIVEGKENIYIIDTNVFVNCPNIIDRIGHKYKVIIPAKVLEELDKLKLKITLTRMLSILLQGISILLLPNNSPKWRMPTLAYYLLDLTRIILIVRFYRWH